MCTNVLSACDLPLQAHNMDWKCKTAAGHKLGTHLWGGAQLQVGDIIVAERLDHLTGDSCNSFMCGSESMDNVKKLKALLERALSCLGPSAKPFQGGGAAL